MKDRTLKKCLKGPFILVRTRPLPNFSWSNMGHFLDELLFHVIPTDLRGRPKENSRKLLVKRQLG